MLKKSVQQGGRRVETGGVAFPPTQPRAVGTALFPDGVVEDFDEPRTMPGERRVSARRGWAGEKSGFFRILIRGDRAFGDSPCQ